MLPRFSEICSISEFTIGAAHGHRQSGRLVVLQLIGPAGLTGSVLSSAAAPTSNVKYGLAFANFSVNDVVLPPVGHVAAWARPRRPSSASETPSMVTGGRRRAQKRQRLGEASRALRQRRHSCGQTVEATDRRDEGNRSGRNSESKGLPADATRHLRFGIADARALSFLTSITLPVSWTKARRVAIAARARHSPTQSVWVAGSVVCQATRGNTTLDESTRRAGDSLQSLARRLSRLCRAAELAAWSRDAAHQLLAARTSRAFAHAASAMAPTRTKRGKRSAFCVCAAVTDPISRRG